MPTSRTALPLSRQGCSEEHLIVERVIFEMEGVVTASINPATEMAYVEYDPALTDPDALFAAIKGAGFAPADRTAVRRDRPAAGGGWMAGMPK